MSYFDRYVILLDGGFVLTKIREALRRPASAPDVVNLCEQVTKCGDLSSLKLLRIYYYDAEPATDKLRNPIDGSLLDLSATSIYRRHRQILDKLELQDDFALRVGETTTNGWKLGESALRNLSGNPRAIEARDFVPNVTQKGVDLRMGLDIARISLTRTAATIVAVTGDSDMIPAFKFARREGARVCLLPLGHGVKRELKAHCDRLLKIEPTDPDPKASATKSSASRQRPRP